MDRKFDIATETGLTLRASFSIDSLVESMSPEQKLLVAELLSLDDTIIEYIVGQICEGIIDPRNDGTYSFNSSAIESARETIVSRLPEFTEMRERTLKSERRRGWSDGVFSGILSMFEMANGDRREWPLAVEDRFADAVGAARSKAPQ